MACNRGFLCISDEHELIFCEMPHEQKLEFADWSLNKVELDSVITNVAFYSRTNSYVVAGISPSPFHLPREDEWHPEWAEDYETATPGFLPTIDRCSIKLISSISHSVFSKYEFEPDEQVLSMKCLNIEVSEQTQERRDMIVVGTGFTRGENVVARGYLYLFDIVDIVPLPDIPETDLRLKLIAREDVKGAVTAISSIGTQGFILASQGQKCMVRGLREDNCILPVAFMDLRYQVSVAKELAGTGLTILGDAFAGMWLVGYSEEPYKMQLLGRDLANPPVLSAEFLPQGKDLFIVVSNDRGILHTLQYDPENPKSDRGQSLLLRSTFTTGYFPTHMQLLPRTPTPIESLVAARDTDSDDGRAMQIDNSSYSKQQILMTTQEGAIVLVTSLSENSYRRLSALQTILTTQLEQYCGLNPRAHRSVETDGVGGR
ncbi:mRNA cleavage and polyadenylation factor subunit, partial [Elasticomyces elasticus]